ncbi:MAG: class I SAM-dependent methyltransferase [Chloroherpetonaceae bacterium]|nr:class I SAM-dependent methyltransferase [Chloroherpetonaceae bacterium]
MLSNSSIQELAVDQIYELRFRAQTEFRAEMWKVLCKDFFQKYIPKDATVLEVAAGYCEFINNIEAKRKIAVDINEETTRRANENVEVILSISSDLSAVATDSVDRIFMSNFLEHITRDEITQTLKECLRVLKPKGQLLILQPNIRFVGHDYWMFFDHITPIDDRALVEVLEVVGYKLKLNIPRFLPYTTNSSLPKSVFLVKLYLMIPLAWKFLGGQAFVVAEK